MIFISSYSNNDDIISVDNEKEFRDPHNSRRTNFRTQRAQRRRMRRGQCPARALRVNVH